MMAPDEKPLAWWAQWITIDPTAPAGTVIYGGDLIGIAAEDIAPGDEIGIDLSTPPHMRKLRPIRRE